MYEDQYKKPGVWKCSRFFVYTAIGLLVIRLFRCCRHINAYDIPVDIDIDFKARHAEILGKSRRRGLAEHGIDLLINVFQLAFEHRH